MLEDARASLRRLVKQNLRKHGYPADKHENTTQAVLQQAEQLSADWATEHTCRRRIKNRMSCEARVVQPPTVVAW